MYSVAHVPENPNRIRVVIEADVEVTDRNALLSAALEFNDDLYASDTVTAIRQLLRVKDVPGVRILGSSTLPRAIEGNEWVEMVLPAMPVQ